MTRDNAPTGLFTRSAQVDVWQVNAVKPVSYEIRMCEDAFDPADEALLEPASVTGGDRRRFVVIDAHVERLHGERIRAYLDHHRVDYRMHVVEVDETLKELATLEDIVRALDAFSIDRRREPLIAIGGGVLMDIVGLVASLYRRGTPVVRVPTTLIGLVDAGVGVKTGVNFNGHKNRLGTYFPASLTLLDRSFLATVDRRRHIQRPGRGPQDGPHQGRPAVRPAGVARARADREPAPGQPLGHRPGGLRGRPAGHPRHAGGASAQPVGDPAGTGRGLRPHLQPHHRDARPAGVAARRGGVRRHGSDHRHGRPPGHGERRRP